VKVQQTPKPEAQFPSTDPDFAVHSVLVKQVPSSPEFAPVQTSLGNVTMENNENSSENKEPK